MLADNTMLAVSLDQPWASAVADALKIWETRSWKVRFGSVLAIHATRRKPLLGYVTPCMQPPFLRALNLDESLTELPEYPLGAILAVVRVIQVARTDDVRDHISWRDRALGNWGYQRFGWKLELLERFNTPQPARGRQGIWHWQAPFCIPPAWRIPQARLIEVA